MIAESRTYTSIFFISAALILGTLPSKDQAECSHDAAVSAIIRVCGS